MGPGGDGLGHIARVANAAVGDERNAASWATWAASHDRGDLRHADAGNDPRRADRARPDADFHGVGPGGDQVPAAASAVATFPATTSMSHSFLMLANRFDHVGRMAVGTIDNQHIDAFLNQAGGPFVIVHADGGPDPQPALPIFAGFRKAPHHVNVFDRDQSRQPIIFVNQQKLLDLFCHQNLLSFLKRYSPRRGDQVFPLVMTLAMGISRFS